MTELDKDSGGFRSTYGVELLYSSMPDLQKAAILRAIRKRCVAAEALDGSDSSDLLAFYHPDHQFELSGTTVPAQTFIAPIDKPFAPERLESSLQQSWKFPEARAAVARCTSSLLVSDLMSSPLPYQERLDLFCRTLLGILELAPPEAIHWVPTQQVVNPFSYMSAAKESPSAQFFAGALNVRFFRVEGSAVDMIMDTLGLAALGLPDLQCHYRGLEPGDVAQTLFNTAWYVFEEGDVIDDGHTVEGAAPGSKWRAQHEESLIEPRRVVLDLNPGAPYAAGKRRLGA